MLIPARRCDTGTIATTIGEARVCPGNPGRLDFHTFALFEQVLISSSAIGLIENGSVPRATHDSDALKSLFLRASNTLAHMSLAQCFNLIFRLLVCTQCAHRFQNTLEQVANV